MRRLLLAATFVFLAQASIASACINDRESNQSEKEFKSNYLEQPVTPVSPTEPENNLLVIGGTTAGTGLLLSAFAVGFFFTRRNSND